MELFLIAVIFFEFFEIFWQRGDSIKEYIKNLYYFYNKNLILFICMHPSLYFYIFLQIYFHNYSFLASSITVIKALDITFKISLLHKIRQNQNLGIYEILIKQNEPIPVTLKYLGIVLYPIMFYFAYIS